MKRVLTLALLTAAAIAVVRCAGTEDNNGTNTAADTGTSGSTDGSLLGPGADAAQPGADASPAGADAGADAAQAGPDASTPSCDPVAKTGCTAASTKCTIVTQNGDLGCGPSSGAKADGQACADDSECAAGLVCTKFKSSDPLQCHTFCHQKSNCPANQDCIGTVPAYPQTPLLCVPITTCDPWAQNCATATDGCYPNPQDQGICLPAGSKTAGTACTATNECEKGSMCFNTGTGGTCRKICDPAGGTGHPTCSTGTCTGYGISQTQNSKYGVCL